MSLFQSTFDNSKENLPPDHIYYNATKYVNTYLNPAIAQYEPATYNKTRTAAYLANPSQYNMTITRLSISGDCIPRVEQPLETTALNTYWWVNVSYNGVYYDQPVLIPVSSYPDGQPGRVIFNIEEFVYLINQAFAAAQAAMISDGGPAQQGTVFMSFDSTTGLFTLNIPTSYGQGLFALAPADGVGVGMSLGLYGMFGGFDAYVPRGPIITYNNHEVVFRRLYTGTNFYQSEYPTFPPTGLAPGNGYIQSIQESSKPSSVMAAHRLIVTTTQLPVYPEFVSDITSLNNTQGGNNAISIVTDFFIGHDGVLEHASGTIVYTPSTFRLISMTGSSPIASFDLSFSYQTADGTIRPLYLPPGGELDCKVLFLKKGLTS